MTAVDTGSNLLWPQLQRIAAECFRGVLGQLAGFPITVDLRAVTPEDAENQRNRRRFIRSTGQRASNATVMPRA